MVSLFLLFSNFRGTLIVLILFLIRCSNAPSVSFCSVQVFKSIRNNVVPKQGRHRPCQESSQYGRKCRTETHAQTFSFHLCGYYLLISQSWWCSYCDRVLVLHPNQSQTVVSFGGGGQLGKGQRSEVRLFVFYFATDYRA